MTDASSHRFRRARPSDPCRYPYVCHAEMNAIVNSNANLRQLSGRTRMYVTLFPCQECAKMMLQAGIREVR